MPDMMDWLTRHGATILIFGGGGFSAVASFIVWWQASGEREKRRVGYWPVMILLGAVISGSGALWAGLGQDRLFDYLSGGDSYGWLQPLTISNRSFQFLFVQHGGVPLYDVTVDAIDLTKWRKLSNQSGFSSNLPQSGKPLSVAEADQLWELSRETRTSLNVGNIGPDGNRLVWEVPVPELDDQRYLFNIWARNGLVTETLLMHRGSSGWVWAWRVERTSPQVNKGKPRKLDEQIAPGFPTEKLIWD